MVLLITLMNTLPNSLFILEISNWNVFSLLISILEILNIIELLSSDLYVTHSYIYNRSVQPFSKDYWPSLSHYLCLYVLILYICGGTYSLKSIPNDKFFFLKNFSWRIYLLSEFLPEICWELNKNVMDSWYVWLLSMISDVLEMLTP